MTSYMWMQTDHVVDCRAYILMVSHIMQFRVVGCFLSEIDESICVLAAFNVM